MEDAPLPTTPTPATSMPIRDLFSRSSTQVHSSRTVYIGSLLQQLGTDTTLPDIHARQRVWIEIDVKTVVDAMKAVTPFQHPPAFRPGLPHVYRPTVFDRTTGQAEAILVAQLVEKSGPRAMRVLDGTTIPTTGSSW